jgi:arginyl-tRNA synthetase
LHLYLYLTHPTPQAAIKHRVDTEKADWIVYVTDAGQSVHFQQVFGAARKAQILVGQTEGGPRVDHVGFGLVLGEDGKRLRTRSGDIVRLVELLDEAYERCKGMILERRPDIETEELEASAKAMGYGAIKYADLKNNRNTDYRFAFDKMLDFNGNTAVYLLYAHARICSLLKKSGKDVTELAKTTEISLTTDKERDLALHLNKFPEMLQEMLQDLLPNRITDYLYELSYKYNDFYNNCPVIGSEQEDSRLCLCEASAVIMRACFHLVGITPLYRI